MVGWYKFVCLIVSIDSVFQVIALKTQLSYFKNVEKKLKDKLGSAEAERLLSQAVYIFSVGTNDYVAPLTSNSTLLPLYHSNKQAYVGMVIGNFTNVIKVTYITYIFT